MLEITVGGEEFFDDETSKFVIKNGTPIALEHSLVSLSKWESIWEKPFLSNKDKTVEETYSYISAMCLTPEVAPHLRSLLTEKDLEKINQYIDAKMTATTFRDTPAGRSREVITSELIYYWMIALNIPPEYQTWHLNRLLTLIRICNQKNAPTKKMSKGELAARNRQLNAQRRAQLNTKG